MKFDILRKMNLEIRKRRPFFPGDKICDVFQSNNLVEIGFLSKRCYNDCNGSCIMCDYGAANGTHSVQEYISEMDCILKSLDSSVDTLLLCTNGSFLDDRQIGPKLFQAILKRAGQSNMRTIEVETHYQDVTEEKLQIMKQFLTGKRILVEMGLETTNQKYQSHIIMKNIDLPVFEKKVALIQSFGFYVETNIMVGLPFLSAKEQFNDALLTIRWAFDHQCSPVLFPMNIKPYTLLMDMYRSGYYHPISNWMLPLILNTIDAGHLEKVTIAWYGNREEVYHPNGERAIFPISCPVCAATIYRFYDEFLATADGNERRLLLDQLLSQMTCSCLEQAKAELTVCPKDTFGVQYAAYIDKLTRFGLDNKGACS